MPKGTFKVEADGQEIMSQLLGDSYRLTPEFCKADAAYTIELASLQIQNKFANLLKNTPRTFQFSNCSGYHGMLLFARPMGVSVGTLIIPGTLLTKDKFCFSIGITGKWGWSLVSDKQIAAFMSGLHDCVVRGDETIKWPSGKMVDITSIKITTFDAMCMPQNASHALAQTFANWRAQQMPFLDWYAPREQNSTVDVIINGRRTQEKLGSVRNERVVFYLTKNPNDRPYDAGDFDMFIGHFPSQDMMLIIPATELISHGIMRTQDCTGKTSISCYPNGSQVTARFNRT